MSLKFKNVFTLFTLAILMVAATAQFSFSQTWRANQPPVQSVPQYIPRYPLQDVAKPKTPPATTKIQTNSPPAKTPVKSKLVKPVPSKPKPSSKTKKPADSKKGSSKKKVTKKKATPKKKEKLKPHYGVDYTVYRDRNMYPIDPRKPCNSCARPCPSCTGCGGKLCGNQGRPYQDLEPGGCTCQKKKPTKHPNFSLYWPRPFSAKLDECNPERAAARYGTCQPKRIVDVFDHLSTLKLSSFKRKDNGHCGIGSDPYGCLSESKQASRIPGVGYRFPSEPVDRGLQNFSQTIGAGYDLGTHAGY